MRQLAQKAIRPACAGASLFEFVIVITIVGLLTGLFFQRLFDYQRQLERANVEATVAVLRGLLQMKQLELLSKNQSQDIEKLTRENPMEWLVEKPRNYRGEYYSPTHLDVPKGGWVFDKKSHTLIYLLNLEKTFPGGIPKALKFKVKSAHSPRKTAEELDRVNVTNVSIIQVDE